MHGSMRRRAPYEQNVHPPMMRGFSHPSALLSCPRSRTVRKRIGRSPSPHVRMGSFLFSAKYDRSPSPRRERNSGAGNCPLIRARLLNHLTAFRAGLFDRPSGAPQPSPHRRRIQAALGRFPSSSRKSSDSRSPSPRRERNSGAGNYPLIRARLSNHLTASCAGLFDRPSGAPQPSPHQRRIQAAPGRSAAPCGRGAHFRILPRMDARILS